jgi:hypothetical protein
MRSPHSISYPVLDLGIFSLLAFFACCCHSSPCLHQPALLVQALLPAWPKDQPSQDIPTQELLSVFESDPFPLFESVRTPDWHVLHCSVSRCRSPSEGGLDGGQECRLVMRAKSGSNIFDVSSIFRQVESWESGTMPCLRAQLIAIAATLLQDRTKQTCTNRGDTDEAEKYSIHFLMDYTRPEF